MLIVGIPPFVLDEFNLRTILRPRGTLMKRSSASLLTNSRVMSNTGLDALGERAL